jgi:formylglycine-generating enzyme required for sulfatase activity/serine/threonine protein kinase
MSVSQEPTAPGEPDPNAPLAEVLRRLSGREVVFGRRYEVRGEVAAGGMGTILSVWDGDLNRQLAMKVIRAQGKGSGAASDVEARVLSRFIEEAQITGQLDHPGIVPVHEIGLDPEGRVYFTMQLVAGRDLEHVFELVRTGEEGWSLTRAVGVMLKVCEAMAYAHEKGVVHRDLKPANVMVGRFGEVYVMDWGLARALGRRDAADVRVVRRRDDSTVLTSRREARQAGSASSPLVTMDGDVVGTPAYMSPEQARGDLEHLGPATDVYAAGAILYHLLAGHMPYVPPGERPNAVAVWKRVKAGSPEALAARAPHAPQELVAICEKAMAREPAGRYATMQVLADDLRAYLEGRVVRAYETGAWAEFRKWVARNRALAITSLTAVLLIVAGTTTAALVLAHKNAKILRLADITLLRQLQGEMQSLWPADPGHVADYERWLVQARELAGRLPLHVATLGSLAEHALPAAGPDAAERLRFASTQEQWQHDALSELVQGLEAFTREGDGAIADVERRLAFARTIGERSVSGPEAAARWSEAARSIRDECSEYRGLVVAPQLGLLPIGRDPRSGLWEFAHLQSGEPAERDPDTHELVLSEATGLVFVLLPGGTFLMGAQSTDPAAPGYWVGARENESPPVEVALDPFFVSKYEMTQGQWLRIAGQNPSIYGPDREFDGHQHNLLHPVEQVSWNDCTLLLDHLGLALPTEAQWEYAARGGTRTPWWTGADKASLEGAANLADRAAARVGATWPALADWPELDDGWAVHAPVNTFAPNPFGLYGVCGNVWEWCRDAYTSYETPARAGDGERVDETSPYRMARGGSYTHTAAHAASSYRNQTAPDTRSNHLGLRPARPLLPAGAQ